MRILALLFISFFSHYSFADSFCSVLPDSGSITMYRAGIGTSIAKLAPTKDGACKRQNVTWMQCTNAANACCLVSAPAGVSQANISSVTTCKSPNFCTNQCPAGTSCFLSHSTTTGGTSCEGACPAGEVRDPITQVCGAPPPVVCTAPQVRNPVTNTCVADPGPCAKVGDTYDWSVGACVPPTCTGLNEFLDVAANACKTCTSPNAMVEGQCTNPDCPPGEYIGPVVVTPGAPPVNLCVKNPDPPPEQQGCSKLDPVVAYADDVTICASENGNCVASNGTMYVSSDGSKHCLPNPPDPENPSLPPEPDCPASDFAAYDLDLGKMVCAPKSPDPKNMLDNKPVDKPDKDNDGKPDVDDSDIDGDGTPNGSDSDSDGDGIANGDDPAPLGGAGPGEGQGEGEGKGESVGGGGSCLAKPQCKGSAVECAIVLQTWETRCAVEALGKGEGYETIDRDGEDDLFDVAGLDDETEDLKEELTDLFADFKELVNGDLSIGGAGSLPCFGPFEYGGESQEWCLSEYSDELSRIGPAIILLSYFLAAIIVLRR